MLAARVFFFACDFNVRRSAAVHARRWIFLAILLLPFLMTGVCSCGFLATKALKPTAVDKTLRTVVGDKQTPLAWGLVKLRAFQFLRFFH